MSRVPWAVCYQEVLMTALSGWCGCVSHCWFLLVLSGPLLTCRAPLCKWGKAPLAVCQLFSVVPGIHRRLSTTMNVTSGPWSLWATQPSPTVDLEVTTGLSGGLHQTYGECVQCFRRPLNAWDSALRGTDKPLLSWISHYWTWEKGGLGVHELRVS